MRAKITHSVIPRFVALLIIMSSAWQVPANAHTGVFITAAAGKAQHMVTRFSAGYIHDVNQYFGLGAVVAQGFYSQATADVAPGQRFKASSASNDFMAVFTTYWKRWDLLAEVGGNRRSVSLTTNGKVTVTTKIQPEVVIGIDYNVTQHIAAELSYLRTFGKSKLTIAGQSWIPPNLKVVLAGVRINFF